MTHKKTEGILRSYFNWYYASIGISTIIALTVIVYIQDHLGWQVGLAVPAIHMFLSALFFFLGSSIYVKVMASKSLFTGLAQVLVAAFKNRHLSLPPSHRLTRMDLAITQRIQSFLYRRQTKMRSPLISI